MRVAVYDRYWSTAGGGEKFAGAIAQVLAARHDVSLLAHEDVDLARLGERLALDLSDVTVERIGLAGRLEQASAAYDLLVNASFESSDRNGARRGIYVVHFPQDPWASFSPKQQRVLRVAGPLLGARHPSWQPGPGFHEPDPLRVSRVWWTDGDGHLEVAAPAGRPVVLHLLFADLVPSGGTTATIRVEGTIAGSVQVGGPTSPRSRLLPRVATVRARGNPDGSPLRVEVESGTHRSAFGDDPRDLGVPLVGATVGANPLGWLRAAVSILQSYPPSADFSRSYDLVLSNSEFTRGWVRRYWGCESGLLHPPVTMRSTTTAKEPVILSIGRFFPPGRGHCKKQLEMVQAFGRLVRSGGAEGWELHLVGGCAPADLPYLDAVRAEAQGLPVRLHVDATGEEVDALYGRASVYWHAAGHGEDPEAHPERMEHFGITTVEAMSAGAVPVAYGEAGPLEAFHDGVEGFHFRSLEGLVEATRALVAQPERRSRMARAASERAQAFSMERFAERVDGYVDRLVAEAG